MKKILMLPALSVLLFACQKEISFEDPNNPPGSGGGGGTTTGKQLYRMGFKTGSDSLTIDYTYSTANKITDYKLLGTSGGTSVDETINYTRNSSNVITKEVYKSSSLANYGLTQIVTDHIWGGTKYTYSITKISVAGLGNISDSVVYTYDASNKLTSLIDYVNDGSGSGYVPVAKEEYTYSGSNVASAKYYSYNSQTQSYDVDANETYEYDSKTNPLSFPTDAVVLKTISNYATYFSANNYTKRTVVESGNTASVSRTYTYNSNNMPSTAVSTGASTTNITYFYK